MKRKIEDRAPLVYHFKNKRVKIAFLMYASEHETSIQAMIDEALKLKYPKLTQVK